MSAVVDYSKWDNLEDSDEEAAGAPAGAAAGAPAAGAPAAGAPGGAQSSAGGDAPTVATTREAAGPDGHVLDHKGSMRSVGSLTPKGTEKGRYQFKHEGRVIYEWEQSLDDVNIYVTPPAGVVPDMIDCRLTPNHLTLGIRGNPPFLDEPTGGPIIQKESYFYMSDGELVIYMSKMRKGETWEAALATRGKVDPFTRQEIQRDMMLERFQVRPFFFLPRALFRVRDAPRARRRSTRASTSAPPSSTARSPTRAPSWAASSTPRGAPPAPHTHALDLVAI